MLHKRFKIIMTTINILMAVPVVYVLARELLSPEPLHLSRVFAAVLLMAIPLAGTVAITITGSAVLDDN